MPRKTAASLLAWLLLTASAAFAAGNNGDTRRAGDGAHPVASAVPTFHAVTEIRIDNGDEQPWEFSDSKIDDASPRPENSVATLKSPAVDRAENIRLDRTANKAIHPGKAVCLPDPHDPGRASRRPVFDVVTPSLAVTMPNPRSPPSPATTLS